MSLLNPTDRLANFASSFKLLNRSVQVALRTQLGDETRLTEKRNEVLRFRVLAKQVSSVKALDPIII